MDIIFSLEIIGTIIFALQGSVVAIEKRLDILGITILGLSTAVGGGMLRDIILGNTPPAMFINPIYCIVATATVAIVILTYRFGTKLMTNRHYHYFINTIQFLDAVGLGVFTVVGANISIQSGYGDNMFLCCFVGVLTGVGGGVLRDVLASRTPLVLRKEIYAVASIVGAVLYLGLYDKIAHDLALYIAVGVIVAIRMITICNNMHLPGVERIKVSNDL